MQNKFPPGVGSIPTFEGNTPSLRVWRYWKRHPARAFYLMRGLVRSNPKPITISWPQMNTVWKFDPVIRQRKPNGQKANFRRPPQPYTNQSGCPMCGLPRFSFGWHNDWDGKGETSRGRWHRSCFMAFDFMSKPNEFGYFFEERQNGLCALSGEPLKNFSIDHNYPLYKVYRNFSHLPIDQLLGFWGPGNLRAVNDGPHKRKSAAEARERAEWRV